VGALQRYAEPVVCVGGKIDEELWFVVDDVDDGRGAAIVPEISESEAATGCGSGAAGTRILAQVAEGGLPGVPVEETGLFVG